jgi:hypothetical protein
VNDLRYNQEVTSLDQVRAPLQETLRTEFPEMWNDLKLSVDKNRGNNADPIATGELYGKVNSLFETRTTKQGKIITKMKPGALDDVVRVQDEIMQASERGVITAEDAKSMVKTLQISMAGLATGDKIKVPDSGHYGQAYKAFVKSGANTAEINRMFRDYVVESDKYKFDETQHDTGFMDKVGEFLQRGVGVIPPKKEQPTSPTPDTVTQAILAAQAQQRYSGLVMLPSQPNAVIGQDGSSLAISTSPPQGKADAAINIKAELREDANGNRALVYLDSNGAVVKVEEM